MLGSPFTALVCRLLADRLEPDSLFARRIGGWKGNAKDDALPLSAVGGLHALARSGRCPALSAVYPPHAADPDAVWTGIEAAIEQEDAFLAAYLDGPPQTNEVARSNAILGGCLFIAGKTGTPLELFEIGSSAGLNLSFDRYGYDLGLGRWGSVDAPVQIASRWEGEAPALTTPLTITARSGCDVKPIDPGSASDRDRLLSYIWPDQFERLARIDAALSLAARSRDPRRTRRCCGMAGATAGCRWPGRTHARRLPLGRLELPAHHHERPPEGNHPGRRRQRYRRCADRMAERRAR